MANSTLRINFSTDALGTDLFNYVMNFTFFHNTSLTVTEQFKNVRVANNQTPIIIGAPGTPSSLRDCLLLDYPTLFTAVLEDYDTVLLTSLFSNTTFTPPSDDSFLTWVVNNEPSITPLGIRVVGLSEDRYLINNPIKAKLSSFDNPQYYRIVLVNLSNQNASANIISNPDSSGFSEIGIDAIVKSLFDYPSDASGYIVNDQIVENSNKIKISIYTDIGAGEILGFETVKTFIRGGKRTAISNQTVAGLSILTPTDKLPVWDGYETAEYYLDDQNLIRKRLLADVPLSRQQQMRPKGCNEVYVKFLNQRGGYSNWLFESHTDNESNNNLGGFVRNDLPDDLGNESEGKLQCSAKVPKAFKQLMLDLIVSPEIYAMRNGTYERVRSGRNSIAYDEIKRSYNVNINFELDYRFNPSLLWSN